MTVLIADPPWRFSDRLPETRGAESHYKTMTWQEICAMPLPASVGADAVLFLWRVASMQAEALAVAQAWGFTIKSELVWRKMTATGKQHFGMGRIVRASHEVCLIGTRGRVAVDDHSTRSLFDAPEVRCAWCSGVHDGGPECCGAFDGVVRAHSQKPEAFYEIVNTLYPDVPKVELFARTVRPGYEQYGDELGSLNGA